LRRETHTRDGGVAATVTVLPGPRGTHATSVVVRTHAGVFQGEASTVAGADDAQLLRLAGDDLLGYGLACASVLSAVLGPAQADGAHRGGGQDNGGLLSSGDLRAVDEALGAPAHDGTTLHRCVRLAASFAVVRAMASASSVPELDVLRRAGATDEADPGPSMPGIAFTLLRGGRSAAAALDCAGPAATALAGFHGGGLDLGVMPLRSLAWLPSSGGKPSAAVAAAGHDQAERDEGSATEDGVPGSEDAAGDAATAEGVEASGADEAAAAALAVSAVPGGTTRGTDAAGPMASLLQALRVEEQLRQVLAATGVAPRAAAGGVLCPSVASPGFDDGVARAAAGAGADAEAAARVSKAAGGRYCSQEEGDTPREARARAVRACWLLAQAIEGAGVTGGVIVDAGASEWAVSDEEVAAAAEAAAGASAGKDKKKGAKGKDKAKAKKKDPKTKGGEDAAGAEGADALEGSEADEAGPLRYDLAAAGSGRSTVVDGAREPCGPELVGSEGVARLLWRVRRLLRVVAAADALGDAAGSEAAIVARATEAAASAGLPRLASLGTAGWSVATHPSAGAVATPAPEGAATAEDSDRPADAEPAAAVAAAAAASLPVKCPLSGSSPVSSVTELLAGLRGCVVRLDDAEVADALLADAAAACGAALIVAGAPGSSASACLARRMHELSLPPCPLPF